MNGTHSQTIHETKRLGLRIGLFFFIVAGHVEARMAKIRWEVVPTAVRYELRILQGGEEIVKTTTPPTSPFWRGSLSPGYYTFQIRAIDRTDLAGNWTKANLILVKPDDVQLSAPLDQAQVTLTEKSGRLFLRWRRIGKRVRYLLDMKTEGGTVQKTIFEKGEYEVEEPASGILQWRVTPQIQAEGSVDRASLGNFEPSIVGDRSKWREIDLALDAGYLKAKLRFRPPIFISLQEKMPVPFGAEVVVGWNHVEAAEAYEIRYTVAPVGFVRAPSAIEKKTVTLVSKEAHFSVPVETGKRYEVTVRALSHINERGVAGIISPEAKQAFEIDESAPSPKPPNLVYLRGSASPYSSSRVSPSAGFTGDIEGAGGAMEIGVRHFWSAAWQSDLSFLQEFQEVELKNDARVEVKSFTHYVWHLFGVQSGWLLRAGAGLGIIGYTLLSPDTTNIATANPGLSRSHVSTFNLIPSLELEKQLTTKVSLGLDLKVPLLVKVGDASNLSAIKARPLRNYRLTFGLHWSLGASFILDAMIGKELRSLEYEVNGVAGEESSLNATRLGVGFSYLW